MMQIIILAALCLVSLFWLGPWCSVLFGGKPFLAVLGTLAIALALAHLWPWLTPPLVFALIGAIITANWRVRRGV
jgi:hypothetical protein